MIVSLGEKIPPKTPTATARREKLIRHPKSRAYTARMIFNHYRDLFETCAPLFWPWLWLQLAALRARKARDGRERLIMVTWWGQVTVLAVGDAPTLMATGAARPAANAASYHAIISARYPGDALHTGMPSDAAPCAPLCHAMLVQTPVFQPNLADKSFVASPG